MSDPQSIDHWRQQIAAAVRLHGRGRQMVESAERTIAQAEQKIRDLGGRP